jgi:hypothetical protein
VPSVLETPVSKDEQTLADMSRSHVATKMELATLSEIAIVQRSEMKNMGENKKLTHMNKSNSADEATVGASLPRPRALRPELLRHPARTASL